MTGGGQTTSATTVGAGSTIAFTAQSPGLEGTAAKGRFQLRDATQGTVSCVVVPAAAEGMPAIGGTSRAGEDSWIDVTDDGQGGDAMDRVSVRRGAQARDGEDP
ncbi:MAG: hypothetical protein JWN08_2847 [Frankiales bacterium]|nr:hypothetical protein [Frankiales bacterium]